MKIYDKRSTTQIIIFLLGLLISLNILLIFPGCEDADLMLRPLVQNEPAPYTGRLIPVGNVKQFGVNAQNAIALEYANGQLYMLANHGSGRNRAQYLFTVDSNTGLAEIVNTGATNLGGDFRQGRGFTQTNYVAPVDMTYDGTAMYAICPVIDSVVSIDLETGFAGRITFDKDFCLRYPEGETFSGSVVIGAGKAIVSTPNGYYMWGVSGRSQAFINNGHRSFGAFYQLSNNLRCATPIGDRVHYGQPSVGEYPDEGETHAYSLEYDGQYICMSGADTQSLYILNELTGKTTLISKWSFAETPDGYEIHEGFGILDIEQNTYGGLWITGLAYDGQTMFAICGFTDRLYKLERGNR